MQHVSDLFVSERDLRGYISAPQFKHGELRFTLPVLESPTRLLVQRSSDYLWISASNSKKAARRWLNDMLMADTQLSLDELGREIHIYGRAAGPMEGATLLADLCRLIRELRRIEEWGDYSKDDHLKTY